VPPGAHGGSATAAAAAAGHPATVGHVITAGRRTSAGDMNARSVTSPSLLGADSPFTGARAELKRARAGSNPSSGTHPGGAFRGGAGSDGGADGWPGVAPGPGGSGGAGKRTRAHWVKLRHVFVVIMATVRFRWGSTGQHHVSPATHPPSSRSSLSPAGVRPVTVLVRPMAAPQGSGGMVDLDTADGCVDGCSGAGADTHSINTGSASVDSSGAGFPSGTTPVCDVVPLGKPRAQHEVVETLDP
jgi:hypothetical protein